MQCSMAESVIPQQPAGLNPEYRSNYCEIPGSPLSPRPGMTG
jgi:hypothetical protein